MSRRAAVRLVARGLRQSPGRSVRCIAWFLVAYAANVLARATERARDELSYLDDYAFDRARDLDFHPEEL